MAKLWRLMSLSTYSHRKPRSFSIFCLASIVACIIASSISTARAINTQLNGRAKRSIYDIDAGWPQDGRLVFSPRLSNPSAVINDNEPVNWQRQQLSRPSISYDTVPDLRELSTEQLASVLGSRPSTIRLEPLNQASQLQQYDQVDNDPDWLNNNDEKQFQKYLLKLQQQQTARDKQLEAKIENENLINLLTAELPVVEFAPNGDDNQAYDQAKLRYQLESENNKRQDLTRQQPEEQRSKFTTLLENEEADDNKQVADAATTTTTTTTTTAQPPPIKAPLTSASIPSNDNDNGIVSQSPFESAESSTSGYSYGKVVNGEPETGEESATNQAEKSTSFFHRAYKNVVAYLPFLDQLAHLRNPSGSSQQTKNDSSSGSANSRSNDPQPTVVVSDKRDHRDGPEDDDAKNDNNNNGYFVMDSSEMSAKPRVSVQLNGGIHPTLNGQVSGEQEQQEGDSKKAGVSSNNEVIDKKQPQQQQPEETRRPTQVVRVDDVKKEDMNDVDELMNNNGFDNNGKGNKKKNRVRVDLYKKSPDFLMPYSANDQLVLQTTTDDDEIKPEGLAASKYIYAPTHHYYLGSAIKSSAEDGDNQASAFSLPQAAHLRRIHPGDQVFGAYDGGLKGSGLYRASAKGEENSYMMLNKTNDFYFLVMVGAFCAMAMAVVLAAGLFAYRIQQNRKTNLDTDYPTYGVVGPNNLSNGKCGAASFVGGYFGANGSAGTHVSTFGSKSGSTKNIPDSASGDSGVGATNSDKSCGKRSAANSADGSPAAPGQQQVTGARANYMNNQNAARMYHYQHQKQQMIISDRTSTGRHTSASDLDSEEENEEGSYTVYECPGLASAHEMEIKNPLFNDDRTP